MDQSSLLSTLRASVTGRVIGPEDSGYDEARTLFYGGFDRRPTAIVRVADSDDVAKVVSFAGETGSPLAVRSGGHSVAGHSVIDEAIVLDLSDMRGVEVDAAQRTAWAQAGLTAAEFSAAAGAHGLAIGFGDTGSVGIGGITLGGGVGYLVRKYGLTIDDLIAADIVTADGRLVRADAGTNPDLFWAIRGGGGNFGVATRFQFRMHELPSVVGGMLFLPATPEVVAGFMAEAESAPEELSAIANVMPAMPMPFLPAEQHGRLVVMAFMCYAGPTGAGQRALAPFRALAEPIADLLRPMSYHEIYPPEPEDYHPTAVGHTMFMDRVGLDEAKTIVEYLEASDAMLRVTQLRVMGGAMARVPVEATAFAYRGSRIMANVGAFYEGPEDMVVRRAWVEELAGALRQSDGGAYVGFLGDEGEERVRAAYPGSTWERLRQVKARYDPDNLFRFNQNIPPGGSA
jgi:FAD/FMN-containing dehydrogenase